MKGVYTYCVPTKVVYGNGSLDLVSSEVKLLGGTKVLIVTDPGLVKAGIEDQVGKLLQGAGLQHQTYTGVTNSATLAAVLGGREEAIKFGADCVIPLGGGSGLAVGKGVAVMATNGPDFYALVKRAKLPNKPLPVVAIPTTAGSGSEVSQFIPLLDEEKKVKVALGGIECFPQVAILDPRLLSSVPYMQALYSGVDALTHGIESCWTDLATPFTDGLAVSAVKILMDHLRSAAINRNQEALELCLIGSAMANMACGNARLGLVHHINMYISSYCPKIPYGLGIGVLLPIVMDYNLPACVEKLAMLAAGTGCLVLEKRKGAEEMVIAVKKLLLDLGFPRSFSADQMDAALIPRIAQEAASAHCYNIRRASVKDIEELLRRALEGWSL